MLTKKEHAYDHRVAAIHKLRVNVKSLASEARIIRREEHRCGLQYLWELQNHRRGRVRSEARYSQLALAFIRGRKYSSVEHGAAEVVEVRRLVEKIGRYYKSDFEEVGKWLKT